VLSPSQQSFLPPKRPYIKGKIIKDATSVTRKSTLFTTWCPVNKKPKKSIETINAGK